MITIFGLSEPGCSPCLVGWPLSHCGLNHKVSKLCCVCAVATAAMSFDRFTYNPESPPDLDAVLFRGTGPSRVPKYRWVSPAGVDQGWSGQEMLSHP
jgi:hypothetical protein